MKETPLKTILDRDLYSVFIKENFQDTLELLEEVINYGTNLIPRCFESSDKEIKDIVIIISFLKHAVSLLDSIHILTSKGATTVSFLSLRSLFELSIYFNWIFRKDTEKRASLYFVWDLRKRLYWALSVKKGTPENIVYQQHMKDSPIGIEVKGLEEKDIDAEINLLKKKLNTPECKSINQEFDKSKKGTKDKEWYTPEGISSLRDMAKKVGKEGMYKVFYSFFSNIAHGLSFDKQVRFLKGNVVYEPIRNLTQLDQIFRNSFNFAFEIYRNILNCYRPGEIENFNRKYKTEWRSRFLSIKKVEYKNGTYTISGKTIGYQIVEMDVKNCRLVPRPQVFTPLNSALAYED